MSKLAFAVAVVALLAQPAVAGPWCGTVSADVPDGHLDVHGGPSEDSPVIRQLAAGEYVELNEKECGHELDAERTIVGTICATAESGFGPLEYIKSADVGAFLAPQNHKGWVIRNRLTPADCIEHRPA